MTELKDILSISGYPGLFRNIAQGRTGIIVESLLDGHRMNAYPTAKISSLEDIAVFTGDGETKLVEVLRKIREKEKGGQGPDHKADKQVLLDYFAEVIPNYDRQRVYLSDIKKIISWYNILQQKSMLDILDRKEEDKEKEGEAVPEQVTDKTESKTRGVKKLPKPAIGADKEATKPKAPAKMKSPAGKKPLSK